MDTTRTLTVSGVLERKHALFAPPGTNALHRQLCPLSVAQDTFLLKDRLLALSVKLDTTAPTKRRQMLSTLCISVLPATSAPSARQKFLITPPTPVKQAATALKQRLSKLHAQLGSITQSRAKVLKVTVSMFLLATTLS